MSFTVKIRTLKNEESTIDNVTSETTIAQLKDMIRENNKTPEVNLLVHKGKPLKDVTATLGSIGAADGDVFIVTFKKPSPTTESDAKSDAPAATTTATKSPTETTSPTSAQTTSTTEASGASTDAASGAAAAAIPAAVPAALVDWSCPLCTYNNSGARTVCEICNAANPNRAPRRAAEAMGGAAAGAAAGGAAAAMSATGASEGGDEGADPDYLMALALQNQELGGNAAGGGGMGLGMEGFGEEGEDGEVMVPIAEVLRMAASDPELASQLGQALQLSPEQMTQLLPLLQAGGPAALAPLLGALSDPDVRNRFEQVLQNHLEGNEDEDEDYDEYVDY